MDEVLPMSHFYKDFMILGAGGFAREVCLAAYHAGMHVDGYLSDDPTQRGQYYERAQCLGPIEELEDTDYSFTPGIGSPAVRFRLVERALAKKWLPRTVISPHAHMSPDTRRAILRGSPGTVICGGVQGTINLTIGSYVNVNLNCTLGHDCTLEDYVNLAPGVHISGYAYLERGVDVGTGAVILPSVRIGRGATIGAGAVVNKDIPAGEVWVGIPAKRIK